jgi:hypothetical protein
VNVYTRHNGKLAHWDCATDDPAAAIATLRETLPKDHKAAVLAVVVPPKPKSLGLKAWAWNASHILSFCSL